MKRKYAWVSLLFLFGIVFLITSGACSKKEEGPLADKGIGPVKSITLATIDPQKAALGQQIFQSKCSACHKLDEKYVGPALKGVTQRRAPEWILNQILNPTEMTQKDPIAKELLATYLTQMTPQNLTEDEAKNVLEYFRQVDSGKP